MLAAQSKTRPTATDVFRTLDNYFSRLQNSQQCKELTSFSLQEGELAVYSEGDSAESDEELRYSH